MGVVSGVISPIALDGTISGELSNTAKISGELSSSISIDGTIGVPLALDVPYYYGDYDVTPLANQEVILPTKGLRMYDDVTVHEIPYTEVSNLSGGYTVSIG